MISHELFSKVTGIDVISGFGADGYSDYHHISSWNIYELAYKCKEWATKQDRAIFSGSLVGEKGFYCDVKIYGGSTVHITTNQDTEPEAIFKACEWILKEGNES